MIRPAVKRLVGVLEDGPSALKEQETIFKQEIKKQAKPENFQLVAARDSQDFRKQASDLLIASDQVQEYDLSILSDGNMPHEGFIGTVNAINQLVEEFPNKIKSVFLALRTSAFGAGEQFKLASENLSKEFLNNLGLDQGPLSFPLARAAKGPTAGNPMFIRELLGVLGNKLSLCGKKTSNSLAEIAQHVLDRNL